MTNSETVYPDPLEIAVAQMRSKPGEIGENLKTIEGLVALSQVDQAKLVILPEMATTGYFISDQLAELAEREDGETSKHLGKIAARYGVYLVVGMPISADGAYYDAQLLYSPKGDRIATYRKTHLFSAEREWFSAGSEPMVVDTPLGRIGMSVCYDLLFPEYVRKLTDMGADVIINSTNWITNPFQRNRWGWNGERVRSLASIRALENGIWLAMSCCVGREWEFDSIGHSCIVAPSGKIMASLGEATGVTTHKAVFQEEDLDQWRSIATYLEDRRPELY